MEFNLVNGKPYLMRVYVNNNTWLDGIPIFESLGFSGYFKSIYGSDELGWNSNLPQYTDANNAIDIGRCKVWVRSLDDNEEMPPFCSEPSKEEPDVCYGFRDPWCVFIGENWPWFNNDGTDEKSATYAAIPGTCHIQWDENANRTACGNPATEYYTVQYNGPTDLVELSNGPDWFVYDVWDLQTGKCIGSIDPNVMKQWGDISTQNDFNVQESTPNISKNILNEGSIDQKKSETNWGWIIGGITVVVLGGGAVYYFMNKKKSGTSNGQLIANEPARLPPLTKEQEK